jgi:hypothetical protein
VIRQKDGGMFLSNGFLKYCVVCVEYRDCPKAPTCLPKAMERWGMCALWRCEA